jgi:hypothetical protein
VVSRPTLPLSIGIGPADSAVSGLTGPDHELDDAGVLDDGHLRSQVRVEVLDGMPERPCTRLAAASIVDLSQADARANSVATKKPFARRAAATR